MKYGIYAVVVGVLTISGFAHAMAWETLPCIYYYATKAKEDRLNQKQRLALDLSREFDRYLDQHDGTGRSPFDAAALAMPRAAECMERETVAKEFQSMELYALLLYWCTERWHREELEEARERTVEEIELVELNSSRDTPGG